MNRDKPTVGEVIHMIFLVALVIVGFYYAPLYTLALVIVAWSDR